MLPSDVQGGGVKIEYDDQQYKSGFENSRGQIPFFQFSSVQGVHSGLQPGVEKGIRLQRPGLTEAIERLLNLILDFFFSIQRTVL